MTNGIITLLLQLAEHVGLIIAAAFLLFTLGPFRRVGLHRDRPVNTLFLILIFGGFGITGTYGGDMVLDSFANLRAMSIIAGGLYGGPAVGLGAGLIAGVHRVLIDIGGFSAVPCGIATLLEGIAAGYVCLRLGKDNLNWKAAVLLGIVGESLHMGFVLLMSRPFADAVALVQVIALPMIMLNAAGAGLFVHVIRLIFTHSERRDSNHASKILNVANMTVSHLRSGLHADSAAATARIIRAELGIPAVALTDREQVLAHVGVGSDHHLELRPIQTDATREVIASGRPVFLQSAEEIGCHNPGCPFRSGILVPLRKGEEIVGTLKLYGTNDRPLDSVIYELARGLGNLFSTQLELEDLQLKSRMLAQAEIRRLQAQINPHFLFNSLNAIASFCRTSPVKARELLLDLARYMRGNIADSREFVPLSEEMDRINAYLAIEQARFGDRFRIAMDFDPSCESWLVPPLMIQPLVENAIQHGISPLEEGGTLNILARREGDALRIDVRDDGRGMEQSAVSGVFNGDKSCVRDCIGLRNCNERLEQIYGTEYRLRIDSAPGQGTTVTLRIPSHAKRSANSRRSAPRD